MFLEKRKLKNEKIELELFSISKVKLFVKREDLLHPFVSGNKFRKLKYNIYEAKKLNKNTLLTFGGAYSNHIVATAAAGKEMGIKTIGIIRGEELASLKIKNPTLKFAKDCGMYLHYVSRVSYRDKESPDFIEKIKEQFGNFYFVPEGGTNEFAIKGCQEILSETDKDFDYVCTAVGTGGTLAGLVKSSKKYQQLLGFSALKGTFQNQVVEKFTSKNNFKIIDDYCFEGYAKIDLKLIRFINEFKVKTGIPLDPVYTGKMMFGIFDLINKGYFKENTRILAIHTGGLQGIVGMNEKLKKKKLPQIK